MPTAATSACSTRPKSPSCKQLQPILPHRTLLLRQLAALPLDAATYNAIARAAKAYPHLLLDQDGRRMTLQSWGQAVLAGQWTAPGLGRCGCLRRVREVVGDVAGFG